MARKKDESTRETILRSAHECVLESGYASLSTRRVAERAGVPLSQIHYHFGSKQQLLMALLGDLDRALLERQRGTFAEDTPLWKKWRKACDYLDADIESGYVRVLQEMIAAGYADAEIAEAMRKQLSAWLAVLTDLATQAQRELGLLGPLAPREAALLIGAAFLGIEQALLLGFDERQFPARRALRRMENLIRSAEEGD